MGNAALKSCVQVAGSVRILKADGKFLEFVHPVLAIQVMKEHPGYLVVRLSLPGTASTGALQPSCGKGGAQVQQERKICMLRADEQLQPGETYYLIPIPRPAQPKKAALKAPKATSRVASSFEYSVSVSCREKKSCKRPQEESVMSPKQTTLGELLEDLKDASTLPTFEDVQYRIDALENRRYRSTRRARRVIVPQISWKPALESIPESSLEFRRQPVFQPAAGCVH